MLWVAKAALQHGLSLLPAPATANYILQRHVTRKLPARDAAYRRRIARAMWHFRGFTKWSSGPTTSDAVFYEFGAGWDLFIPLVYASLGVDRQVVTDAKANARPDLVNHALAWLSRRRPTIEETFGVALRKPRYPRIETIDDLEELFGIAYLAPRDAKSTGLAPHSVDFISSTSTLEHIPAPDVLGTLVECKRLLKGTGALSCTIDLQDHYSYFDKSLSRYNFLKFSTRTWRIVNPSLGHQNRLRYPDYVRLFDEAGFAVVAERVRAPTAYDLAVLRRLRLAEPFRAYTLQTLGVRRLAIIARPREVRPTCAS